MSGLLQSALGAQNQNFGIEVSVEGQTIREFSRVNGSISAESTEQTISFEVFRDSPPKSPVYPWLKDGKQATVKIGGSIVLTGEVESRRGEGKKDSYRLTFTVKSKPKKGQKSHAKIGKGQRKNTTPKKLIDEIAKNAGLTVKYKNVEDEEIKQHIILGDVTADKEIKNIARDRGYLVYADHDGHIRVESEDAGDTGCDLIVGENIIEFNVGQTQEKKRGKIKATGTRVLSKETNRKGTLTPQGIVQMKNVKIEGDWVVWVDGDHTPKSVKRRAKYEANRRDAASKTVSVTTFGLTAPDGKAYRVNNQHYVEVPSESVYDMLRLKSLEFTASKDEITTTLSLGPIKSLTNKLGGASGAAKAKSAVKRQQAGAKIVPGQYPEDWNAAAADDVPAGDDWS
ncbi:MAG: hypothetical protein AB7F96_16505 [Beijerinckiaceae bacterium]